MKWLKKYFETPNFEWSDVRNVDIGITIEAEKLEDILLKAATNLGLDVNSVNNYITQYKLGSVKEEKVLKSKDIIIKGDGFSYTCTIYPICKTHHFNICLKPSYNKQVEEYLNEVSRLL